MTSEQIELAKRLAAHPRWSRKIGMVLRAVSTRGEAGERRYVVEGPQVRKVEPALVSFVPDLTEDATAGVLLGLLPHGPDARSYLGGWHVSIGLTASSCHEAEGATLGEACALLLLSVWGTP